MADSRTPNLKLFIPSNITTEAKANLFKIDGLAAVLHTDSLGNTTVHLTFGGFTTIIKPAQTGQTSNLEFELPSTDGSAGQALITDGNGVLSWVSVSSSGRDISFNWLNTDGASKTVAHNFGTRKVTVEVLDSSDNYATIEMDSIKRPTDNTVSLVSSAAPTSSWLILIREVVG